MESLDYYKKGVLKANRVILSQAITLVESKKNSHQELAMELVESITPSTGNSIRIGITGVPGVGKSTFIDAFGSFLTSLKHKVAVLSIDPSSTRTKGSILGDKTRMERLSKDPLAYIRPSPSGNQLGGVAHKTRETLLLCEAAGFDIIIVETVGVGQSETVVKDMVDAFILLMLAGGGDELQGIKRGIMEMADMILINKVDGDNEKAGKLAQKEYERALHLFPPNPSGWTVPVRTVSSIKESGLEDVWQDITQLMTLIKSNGYFIQQRQEQSLHWFQDALRNKLEQDFYARPIIQTNIKEIKQSIKSGKLSVRAAIQQLLGD
jgi:LAO/AO transport system kinase